MDLEVYRVRTPVLADTRALAVAVTHRLSRAAI